MNSSSRNGAKVIWLGIHTTEGFMRVRDLRDWKAWPGSSHAASDETGALWGPTEGFVPYDRMAWTLRNGNPISDNLEQCGWARWSRAEWLARPKLLDATARWLAERHKARPWIPLVRLSLAEIRARKPGVLGHGDYTYATGDGTHTDPGPNYPWDVVMDAARAYANGEDDMPTADEIAKAVWEYPIGDNGTDGNLPAWRTQGQTFEELKRPRQSAVTEDGKQSEARMTMGQYAVTADYYGYVTSKAVAGLRASQEELVRALAAVAGGDLLDVDALVARIDTTVKEAMASTVNVQVSVDGDSAA